VPYVGLEPLDEEARRRKLESITAEMLWTCERRPQRALLLAKSLNEDCSTLDRARLSIREWMHEQRTNALLQ
jgi:hypothetical protein